MRVWTLSGPVGVSELAAGLESTGDAVALLRDNAESLSWTWVDGPNAGAGESLNVALAPDTPLAVGEAVVVPALSEGFFGDEEPLVLVGERLPDGAMVPTGLGVGQGAVAVHEAPGGFGEQGVALALAQVGGLGSGAAACVSAGLRGEAVLPDFPAVPVLADYVPEERAFSLAADDASTWVRVTVEGGDGTLRDLYLDGGSHSGELPNPGFTFGYGKTSWSLLALNPGTGTFEDRVAGGTLSLDEAARDSWTSCRVSRGF